MPAGLSLAPVTTGTLSLLSPTTPAGLPDTYGDAMYGVSSYGSSPDGPATDLELDVDPTLLSSKVVCSEVLVCSEALPCGEIGLTLQPAS